MQPTLSKHHMGCKSGPINTNKTLPQAINRLTPQKNCKSQAYIHVQHVLYVQSHVHVHVGKAAVHG